MDKNRSLKVGKIEVVCHETTFSHTEMRCSSSLSKVDFNQANKKDVLDVTRKEYCMATTRMGKLMRDGKPYDRPQVKKEAKPRQTSIWNIGDEVNKIGMEYHMTQTLIDWGIEPVRPIWPEMDKGSVVVPADADI